MVFFTILFISVHRATSSLPMIMINYEILLWCDDIQSLLVKQLGKPMIERWKIYVETFNRYWYFHSSFIFLFFFCCYPLNEWMALIFRRHSTAIDVVFALYIAFSHTQIILNKKKTSTVHVDEYRNFWANHQINGLFKGFLRQFVCRLMR